MADVALSVAKAQAASAALPALLVRAERVAATVILGVHGRKRSGPGENFWQYRPYDFGDSIQRIDWRKSGKSDRILIRENEWEAANTLWLWANLGPRMTYRSKLAQDTKAERATILSLALASLALRGHERVGVLGTGSRPVLGRNNLETVAKNFFTNRDPLPPPASRKRQSSALLVSDFLDDPHDIARALGPLAEAGLKSHLVMIADPAEETLPWVGHIRYEGLDRPHSFRAPKSESLRDDYAKALREQRQAVASLAASIGFTLTHHRTDQPLTPALLALHDRLGQ